MGAKDIIKALPAKNGVLNSLFYRAFGANRKEMEGLVERCADIDSISDIRPLKKIRSDIENNKLKFYSTDANWSNAHIYGIWSSLFGASGEPLWSTPSIEHGLILYDDIFTDTRYTSRPTVATFGDYRRGVIRRFTDRPVYTVGPYINYAPDYYSECDFEKKKRELGKVLLVFPSHSTDASEVTQDDERYIAALKEWGKDYDSILINIFWWNINGALSERFADEGFRVVSAGFRDDIRFLSRLRTIIRLSDMVIGDSVGTHAGYVLALDRPYQYLNLGTTVRANDGREASTEYRKDITDYLVDIFSSEGLDINSMRCATDCFWGYSKLRSPQEVQAMLKVSREIGIRSRGWTGRYGLSARKLMGSGELNDLEQAILSEAMA